MEENQTPIGTYAYDHNKNRYTAQDKKNICDKIKTGTVVVVTSGTATTKGLVVELAVGHTENFIFRKRRSNVATFPLMNFEKHITFRKRRSNVATFICVKYFDEISGEFADDKVRQLVPLSCFLNERTCATNVQTLACPITAYEI